MHGGSNWGFQCDLIAHRVKGYGAAIMTNGANGGALIQQLRRLIQQEYKWDALDAPISRRYGPSEPPVYAAGFRASQAAEACDDQTPWSDSRGPSAPRLMTVVTR